MITQLLQNNLYKATSPEGEGAVSLCAVRFLSGTPD
jgi:hypothetical protein